MDPGNETPKTSRIPIRRPPLTGPSREACEPGLRKRGWDDRFEHGKALSHPAHWD